ACVDGVGVCVASGPTHPAATRTRAQPMATRVAAEPRLPNESRCGIVALDLRGDAPDGGPRGHGTGGEPMPWTGLQAAEERPRPWREADREVVALSTAQVRPVRRAGEGDRAPAAGQQLRFVQIEDRRGLTGV